MHIPQILSSESCRLIKNAVEHVLGLRGSVFSPEHALGKRASLPWRIVDFAVSQRSLLEMCSASAAAYPSLNASLEKCEFCYSTTLFPRDLSGLRGSEYSLRRRSRKPIVLRRLTNLVAGDVLGLRGSAFSLEVKIGDSGKYPLMRACLSQSTLDPDSFRELLDVQNIRDVNASSLGRGLRGEHWQLGIWLVTIVDVNH